MKSYFRAHQILFLAKDNQIYWHESAAENLSHEYPVKSLQVGKSY
jgi:hypothetical protein